MGSFVEYLVDGAKVFTNVVSFVDHVSEELEIVLLVTGKVVNGDVSALSVPVDATVPLL